MPALTDLSYIRALCEKYGFSFSKGFGQNFIVNPGICPKICDAAGIGPSSNVLEIGPGFGTLTRELAARARKVVTVEVDTRLLPVLEETLSEFHNVQVVNQDILKCDIAALARQAFGDEEFAVCANLPYYITSPVIMKLLEDRLPITTITAMVQKEAAERIAAPLGTRQAGAISYGIHYYSRPKMLFSVKPGSFYPPPKVTSAIIQLTLEQVPPLANYPEREARLFALVKAAFAQRRKTLLNAAAAGLHLPKEQLAAALKTAEIDANARPEQLLLQDYILLEQALWPCCG